MKIAFLITHAYGMGGTIRTVSTLANQLCQRHEVELISVRRTRERPFFWLDPRIRIRTLDDIFSARPPGGGPPQLGRVRGALRGWPSRLMNREDKAYPHYNLWTDLRAVQTVRSLDADVVIGTRPALSLFLARWGPRRAVKIAQEHSFVFSHAPRVRRAMHRLYPRLDCVVSLTEANAADMEVMIGDAKLRHPIIPNSIDTENRPISTQQNKLVIAAGRLSPGKRYSHLIRAFARVVERRPDWKLRIYGAGGRREQLQQLILDLELYNHVFLMGQCSTMDREFAKGSLSAVCSRYEGLGMTILESMACGVPVVSYDCDHGPRSIITSGRDGLLVPNGDPAALADGLLELIEDESSRRAMAKAAVDTAAAYDQQVIAGRWEQLFEELLDARRR